MAWFHGLVAGLALALIALPSAQAVSDADWFDISGGLAGMDGEVRATVVRGGVATLGGGFTWVGSEPYNRIVQWDGTNWMALGEGFGDYVFALAYDEYGTLYAGGQFTNAGSTAVNRIAKWDGTNWTALGSGAAGTVHALVWNTNDHRLYVGGEFSTAGGVTARYVATWDPATTGWANVGTQQAFYVNAMVFDRSNQLYVAGASDRQPTTGNTNMWNIAKWNGTGWTNLGSGLKAGQWDGAQALAYDGTNLYVGGDFTNAGGVANTPYVARWNGSAWSAMGSGVTGDYNAVVSALVLATNSQLYVGGRFAGAGNVAGTTNFAKWTGSAWQAAVSNANEYFSRIYSMSLMGTNILVGGGFQGPFQRAGLLSGGWLRPIVNGMNAKVAGMAWDGVNQHLYAVGNFTWVNRSTMNYVARWNGTNWTPLTTGASNGLSLFAREVVWDGARSNLYVGYNGGTAGTTTASRIAQWNPTRGWDSIPPGNIWNSNGINGTVLALAMDEANHRLYVGGQFADAGGVPATNMAMWNGTSWTSVGGGLNGWVYELAWDGVNGHLYAGGQFTTADGVAANRVAKWDGTSWTALGDGFSNTVYAMVWDAATSNLYAGGAFTNAGGVAAKYVAKWDGATWSAVGSGFGNQVADLTLDGSGKLYAVGSFTNAGAVAAKYIAAWNGTTWSACGSGLSGSGEALTYDESGRLFVGGDFLKAGNQGYAYLAGLRMPLVTGVSPSSASWRGGAPITITGNGFGSGADITNVTLCGITAAIQSQTST